MFNQIKDAGYNGIKNMIGTREETLFLDFKAKTDPRTVGLKKEDKRVMLKRYLDFLIPVVGLSYGE
ncbi:hypothetical protein [Paenibacillus sp. W2I17]|uniref:hypothetical protein n=1 Tax=Paenibacillus sp. W2I17 TaxID=3042311 RepID=UPI0027D7F58A|nr:hypothetical protein [Paenibacillus sp. W2I17]